LTSQIVKAKFSRAITGRIWLHDASCSGVECCQARSTNRALRFQLARPPDNQQFYQEATEDGRKNHALAA
jgi:hypothetical protein